MAASRRPGLSAGSRGSGIRASLEAAARKGNVTLDMNGQEPGFVEHMAMLATTLSNTIRRITSYDLFYYSTIKEPEEMFFIFGFDEPIEKTAALQMKGVQLSIWGNPITNVVHKLGYRVERYSKRPLTSFAMKATFLRF